MQHADIGRLAVRSSLGEINTLLGAYAYFSFFIPPIVILKILHYIVVNFYYQLSISMLKLRIRLQFILTLNKRTNSASYGHTSTHLKHFMHSMLLTFFITATPVGHIFTHLPQALQTSWLIDEIMYRFSRAITPLNRPTGQRHFHPDLNSNPRLKGTTSNMSSLRKV